MVAGYENQKDAGLNPKTPRTPITFVQELEAPLTAKPKCTCCPECGGHAIEDEDVLGPGYRVCAACGQEWWTDIDYSKHFAINPSR